VTPQYVIISFAAAAAKQAEIVARGALAREVFDRQFLDPYGLAGERHHPGPGWTVHGVLVGADASTVAAVPIWTWQGADGAPRFLCQATDDGRPPAISVLAHSADDLVDQVTAQLRSPAG
jgi:hypothetical protein